MPVQDFYDFEKDGVIKDRVSEARVFFLSARNWANIENGLSKVFSTGSAVMLDEMGYSCGTDLALVSKAHDPDPFNIVNSLQKLAAVSGWGEFTVTGETKTGKDVTVLVKECIFCSEPRKTGANNTCHFLMGYMRGLIDEMAGSIHTVQEVECIRRGNDACKLRITEIGK